jgi:lipopolysaccharide export system protein LptC
MSSPTVELASQNRGRDLPGIASEDIERRRRLRLRWKRRSALVHLLRILLPALCVALLAILGTWTAVNTLMRGSGAKTGDGAAIRMVNPRFQGRTDAGKPFVLIAASAVRGNKDSHLVSLDGPILTLGSGPPDHTVVRARNGVYNEDTRMLDLTGAVVLDDAKGNHFDTEHALVDTHKDDVTGQNPITGNGPLGRIAGSSYALHDSGAYIRIEGRVKSRIDQHGTGPAPGSAKVH